MSLIHKVSDLFNQRFGSTSLHSSWGTIELKKACVIQNGFAFQSSKFNSSFEGMPLIRIRDILKHNPETFFSGEFNIDYIVKKGDLLVGMDGDFNHSMWKGPDALLNQRVCRIIPNEKLLLPKFLYYGLGDYLKKINENTSSTTVKHLSSKSIGEIPFALPPLPEQQRIVGKLDALFGHLDSLREKLDRIPTLLKNFRQQVLTQAVTGELTKEWREGKGLGDWLVQKADKCCQKVQSGGTPKKDGFSDSGIPFLKVYNIVNNKVDFDYRPQFVTPEAHNSKIKKSKLLPGDVLMNIVGPPLNKIAIVPDDYDEWNLNQAITLFRPKEYLNNKFLYYFFCEGSSVRSVHNETRGVVGQVNISLSQCRNFDIPVPSFEEQHEIVRKVEALFSLADKIESQYASLKAKIDQLPQAILAKAFRGELVGQETKEYVVEEGEGLMAAEPRGGYGTKDVNK